MNDDNFLTAKEECHSKTESAIEEWGDSLKVKKREMSLWTKSTI
jgi:hypothetical protein